MSNFQIRRIWTFKILLMSLLQLKVSVAINPLLVNTYHDSNTAQYAYMTLSSDGNTLYVTDSSPGHGLTILDVSSVTQITPPKLINRYQSSTACTYWQVVLSSDGKTAYIIDSAPGNGLLILNVSQVTISDVPTLINSFQPGFSTGTFFNIALCYNDTIGIITDNIENGGIVIINLSGVSTSSPPTQKYIFTEGLGPRFTSIVLSKDETRAYITDFTKGHGLIILNISNLNLVAPIPLRSFQNNQTENFWGVALSADSNIAYVTDINSGFYIISVNNASYTQYPELIQYYHPGQAQFSGVTLSPAGSTVYVTDNIAGHGLQIFSIQPNGSIAFEDKYNNNNTKNYENSLVSSDGSRIYITDFASGAGLVILETLGCQYDSNCSMVSSLTPFCNKSTHNCIACWNDTLCTNHLYPYCELSTGTCVSCLENTECLDPQMPHCNSSNFECIALCSNITNECNATKFPSTPYCNPEEGTCVACFNHSECNKNSETSYQQSETSPSSNLLLSTFNISTMLQGNSAVSVGVLNGILQNYFDSISLILLGIISIILLFIMGTLRKEVILDPKNDLYWLPTGAHLLNLRKLFAILVVVLELTFFGLIPIIQCVSTNSCIQIFIQNYQVCLISPFLLFIQVHHQWHLHNRTHKKVLVSEQQRSNKGSSRCQPTENEENSQESILIKQIILGGVWILPVSCFSYFTLAIPSDNSETFSDQLIENISFLLTTLFFGNSIVQSVMSLTLWTIQKLLGKTPHFYLKMYYQFEHTSKSKLKVFVYEDLESLKSILKELFPSMDEQFSLEEAPVMKLVQYPSGYIFLTTETNYPPAKFLGNYSLQINGESDKVQESDALQKEPEEHLSDEANEGGPSPQREPQTANVSDSVISLQKEVRNSDESTIVLSHSEADVAKLQQSKPIDDLNDNNFEETSLYIPKHQGIEINNNKMFVSRYLNCNVLLGEHSNPRQMALKNLESYIESHYKSLDKKNEKAKQTVPIIIELPTSGCSVFRRRSSFAKGNIDLPSSFNIPKPKTRRFRRFVKQIS